MEVDLRVGLVVDGYNLYYAALTLCGRDAPGWRWLDLRALVEPRIHGWPEAVITEIHYCTARRGRSGLPESADQDAYVGAITAHDPAVHVHLGKYVARRKSGVLIDPRSRKPLDWPTDGLPDWLPGRQVRGPEGDPEILVSVRTFEEKATDANVATELLWACLRGSIDAAVVISNDSDLATPVRRARQIVPVGLLNPGSRALAGDLAGSPEDGVGGHWWARLSQQDYSRAQLPDQVASFVRPAGW